MSNNNNSSSSGGSNNNNIRYTYVTLSYLIIFFTDDDSYRVTVPCKSLGQDESRNVRSSTKHRLASSLMDPSCDVVEVHLNIPFQVSWEQDGIKTDNSDLNSQVLSYSTHTVSSLFMAFGFIRASHGLFVISAKR